jgi:hypothetical protein
MIISLCIEDQNGDRVVYHQVTHVPFGSLFAKYMSNKGIQLMEDSSYSMEGGSGIVRCPEA